MATLTVLSFLAIKLKVFLASIVITERDFSISLIRQSLASWSQTLSGGVRVRKRSLEHRRLTWQFTKLSLPSSSCPMVLWTTSIRSGIWIEMDEGGYIGTHSVGTSEVIPTDKVRDELLAVGNDGTFFDNEDDGEFKLLDLEPPLMASSKCSILHPCHLCIEVAETDPESLETHRRLMHGIDGAL